MMKTASKTEIQCNSELQFWDSIASSTRKPVECAFGILKNRFPVLMNGVRLHHEDDVVFLIVSCLILHNLCIENGDNDFSFYTADSDTTEVNTTENITAKKIRDALITYVKEVSEN